MTRMFRLAAVILMVLAAACVLAETSVKVEKTAYGGWPNCIRMTNGTVELIATTDVGPRIIRFGFVGGDNLFYENPKEMGKTGGSEWMGFGGHRFWLAPERRPRSYHPDNTPIKYSIEGNTVRLMQGIESTNGMEKELDVTLFPDSSHVAVVHKLTNHNVWPVKVSPWGLTVMRADGEVIFPREPYAPHPGFPDEPGQNIDQRYYAPVQTVALWSFTKLDDPRWVFTSKYIILKGDAKADRPQKIGISSQQGWGAYSRKGQLFIKKTNYQPGATYPDNGCNFEAFAVTDIVELESLGPLAELQPGETVQHREDWYLFDNVKFDNTDESIDEGVLSKVKSLPR